MNADSIAAVILIGGFFLLLLMRLPVALALALSSLASSLYMNVNPMMLIQGMFKSVDSFALLAVTPSPLVSAS